MRTRLLPPTVWLTLCFGLALGASDQTRHAENRGKREPSQPSQNSTCNDVPAHPFDLVLGRPTRDSVTLSVLVYQDTLGHVAYGTNHEQLTQQTPARSFPKGEPVEVVLGTLQPNTRYYYELRAAGISGAAGTFHTQRPPGSEFTFTITADSHLDDRVDAALYQRTLANVLADAPDFHVDLGDTFMTEKHDSRENAARQYLAQRFYFGQLCHAAPLFLVLGNHDGESPRGRGSESDPLAVWSNLMRKRHFPNPVPDGFYTGNAIQHPEAGLLQDYFAWEWGDALFVVLDPFWSTQQQRGRSDNWKRTLGREQYQWLQRTLEASDAKLKFVFIHHLVGGATPEGRGGAEAAPLYEWGGKNPDGTDGFAQNRPGWPAPIHQLLVQNHVTAVFHGHDHLYAQQELDGIVYQEVPQPGTPGPNKRPGFAAFYGYQSGIILGSPGHMRVRVGPTGAMVEYIRGHWPAVERAEVGGSRPAAHTWSVPAQQAAFSPMEGSTWEMTP
ncbi:MAG: metallophosphoesterase [Pirellulaceae bacterium]|nr:metallophosphoesterase [Pirellulaceae bacterium]